MAGLFNYAAKETALVEVNKRGTENVVSFLSIPLQKNLRSFIYWSGLTVFGKFDFSLPTTEDSPRRPDNPYGWSKLHAEEFLLRAYQEKNLPVTIMELSSVYGPGGPIRERYGMALLIKLLHEGRMPNIPIGKAGKRAALIHAEDVIRVAHFLSGVEEARGERYIVTDDTPYTTEELSQFLGELLENPFISFIRLPEKVFDFLVQSSEEARKYGAKPEIDAGLAQMIKLNPHASNAKLMDLARRHGRGRNSPNPLLKYPNSFDGLRQTVAEFKKEGWLR
jgi:nucleoside-diphosphate-sugar epimerase